MQRFIHCVFGICLLLCATHSSPATPLHVIPLTDFPVQNVYVDTLRFQMRVLRNLRFYHQDTRGTLSNLLPDGTGELSYRVWMQDDPAPLVILIPGLGGHNANIIPTALAEVIYDAGYSVAIVSNPFNWEFAQNASQKITPGYPPQDAYDLYRVFMRLLADIDARYGNQMVTETILTGYSLGAVHTLFVALIDSYENAIGFSRFVALSPPVNLLYGMITLDEMYGIWHTWELDQLEEAKNKAVQFYEQFQRGSLPADTLLPFTPEEAQFAIGFVFRMTLTEMIKAIHQRHDFSLIPAPFTFFNRQAFEKEAERFGYLRYVDTFVRAAFTLDEDVDHFDLRELNASGSLPALQRLLRTHPDIRILHTTNDFLLTDSDRVWLQNVVNDRIAFFDAGGHLGYFASDDAMTHIINAIGGTNFALRTPPRVVRALPLDDDDSPDDTINDTQNNDDTDAVDDDTVSTPSMSESSDSVDTDDIRIPFALD